MSNNKQQPKPENPNNQFSNTEPLTHAQRVAIANTMSNNKQGSSVEWFIEQLEEKGKAWENVSIRRVQISIDVSEYMELKTKAKAMHKEEVIDSVGVGSQFDRDYLYGYHDKAEQYYNETFGGNNEP